MFKEKIEIYLFFSLLKIIKILIKIFKFLKIKIMEYILKNISLVLFFTFALIK